MRVVLLAVAFALSVSACAALRDEHAAHHPRGAAAEPGMDRADRQLESMREMHQKMMAAKTFEERQALMAEHMKSMQGGMSMMCEMGTGGAGDAGSNDRMKLCMDMKEMTMQMMRDRESGKPAPTK